MELIDTHAHIYQEDFNPDVEEMIFRAKEAGIEKIVLPNVDVASIAEMENRIQQFPSICKMTLGLHPCYVKENYLDELKTIESRLKNDQLVAIGEIGLDYHWDLTFVNEQKNALKTQLEWALSLELPVILHCRESMQDVIDIVKPFTSQGLGGIFHCFSGTLEEAQEIIEMGFYMGIGGTFTYKKSTLPEILKTIGLDRIVLETDSPYLPPIPHRGKRNEPAHVAIIAQKISDELEIPVEKVAETTTQNAKNVFRGKL